MLFGEKLKLLRKLTGLTQEKFAESIGISRGNLSGLELGKVAPTALVINCISLTYNVDRSWLTDDKNEDINAFYRSVDTSALIAKKYGQLDDKYKKFVENQIVQLLDIQQQDKEQENG